MTKNNTRIIVSVSERAARAERGLQAAHEAAGHSLPSISLEASIP
jgi:hypothetical protein